METIQVVLNAKLLKAADLAAKRQKVNRSALIRQALQEHLHRLHLRDLEKLDRRGYETYPQQVEEYRCGVAGQLSRGDVYLYRFAPPDKQRPVLILTRDSAIGHLSSVTVAPISSTIRSVPSEVILGPDDGLKNECAVNLHNTVTISQERLGKRVSSLSASRMQQVCAALRFSLGCA